MSELRWDGGWKINVNIVEGHGRSWALLPVLFTLTRDVNGPHTSAGFILLVGFSSVSAT